MKKSFLLPLLISVLIANAQPKIVGTAQSSGPRYGGSLFRFNLPATTPGSIYDFDNRAPHRATSGVIKGDGDWLYGSLTYNGVNDHGCFYKIKKDGSGFLKLFDYANVASGIPYLHSDGFIYVMGGNELHKYDPVSQNHSILSNNVFGRNLFIDTNDWIYFMSLNVLYKIKTDGTQEASLHTFSYPSEGWDPWAIIEGANNKLLGLQRWGGANDGGVLFQIDKDGTNFSILHNFDAAGGSGPGSQLVFIDGKFYGTTLSGGANSFGTVYSIKADGTGFRTIHHFTDVGSFANIGISSNGRLFGTFTNAYWDGANYNRMYKMDTSGNNFQTFCSLDQRTAGASIQDLLLLDDQEIFSITSDYGRHEGGVMFYTDTLGNASDRFHFGFSTNGFKPNGGVIKASDGNLFGTNSIGGIDGNGVIYKVAEDGTQFQKIHEFIDAEGFDPTGKLLEASDGKLYGACRNALSSAGILFRLDKTGANFQVIFRFDGSVDGYTPTGSLVEDGAGFLYGTTFYSNLTGGTVFRINKNGTGYSVLRSFTIAADEIGYLYNGLRLYKGYLYGAAGYGGPEGRGGIYRIKTDGSSYQVLHNFTAASGGGELPAATPYLASNGKLYGTTTNGGSNNEGLVYRLDTTGANFVVIRNLSQSTDGGFPWGGLLQASDGLMYGSTQTSLNGGTIFRFNLDGSGFNVIKNFDFITEGQGIASSLIDLNGNFALPVQWVKFTAAKKNNIAILQWETSNEENNDLFEVEKSIDGNQFQKIGTIQATNSSDGEQYTFADNKPAQGSNYYRLRQVDINAGFEFSKIIRLDFDSKPVVTLYPNPATHSIIFTGNNAGIIKSVVIRDAAGRVVARWGKQTGTSQTFDIKHLQPGIYLFEIEAASGKHSLRFAKQ